MNLYCAHYGGQDYAYEANSDSHAESIARELGWFYLGVLEDFEDVELDEVLH